MEDMQITQRFISLEKIIASKNKKLLKILPKPLLNRFKKLICLDRINEIIYKFRDKKGVDFADALLEELKINIQIINPENIPQNREIIVANHPIGSIDGVSLISVIGQKRKDVLFPVNDILCQLPGLKSVFVPINKYGKNSSNHDALSDAFAGDRPICFFPAGTESKIIDGKLQDFKWKKSFVRYAKEYNRNIVPVYIEGGNSKAFYRLYKIRKFFGIKFDLEMILLPREMFKYEGKTIKMIFSKPISVQNIDKSFSPTVWAEKIRSFVYKLRDDKDIEFSVKI